ncbi:type I restriction endonuclease subunit R [Chlorobium phaeovibrioides]|uniref:Type I restriction enzyme endonuclease subunit n=1 Tax=Chlorobium phaeovibrioides TaxID=1094 RepID=A0A432AWK6_CHLPH|nr:type I restriction endonuclease subunit R [Chlorobium phaeovibrioides]RTY39596.1 type I restriction endonuclease subunit R [Chlorobium phaeovibrioides]
MTEDQLEQEALGWLKERGYQHRFGPDIAHDGPEPERRNYREVLLASRLHHAINKLNPQVPATAREDALQQVLKFEHPVQVTANQIFHRLLVNGVPVEYQQGGETRGDFVRLVDFEHPEHNDWLAVNQYTVQGPHHTRRPDIVLFINGLPLIVIELKNPADENADIRKAYDQLQTYKEQISDLFRYNEILVISDGAQSRMGSLSANIERFMAWRSTDGENLDPLGQFNELETMIQGIFEPALLLDFIRYFVLFEDEGTLIKKIAGYHQYFAVRTAIDRVITASQAQGDHKGGVVWHTQGSGKSITMVCFAARVMREAAMQNPTIVVITDRNDLDGQLFGTFSLSQDLLREEPVQVDSRHDLRAKLSNRPSGGIVFTTIQKFMPDEDEDKFPMLSDRHNIVVIADEAHRTQYGFEAKFKGDAKGYQVGYAQHLRDAMPNATFVAFTGTPVSSEDRDTRAVFGDYIHVYDIQQAREDGATVPIYFESRLAKLSLNEAILPEVDEEVEELTEDDEERERNRQKSRWAALERVVGAEPRIVRVAEDLVAHFEERCNAMEGKAMVVAMSRDICVHMYNAITQLRPEWHSADPEKGAIKVIMTGSASDKELLRPHIYSSQVKKRLERRFKDPADPLRMVIVRDMWLTGFDAPSVHTMYVDKPMKGHNLMQAIARVNRVFRDKQGGLVVDYIGIATDLKKALKDYTSSRGRGKPTVDVGEALAVLLEKLDILRSMMHGFDYSGFLNGGHRLMAQAADHILGLEDGKKRFSDNALAMSKAYSLCCTHDEAKAVREEVAFFQAVKVIITKPDKSKKKRSDEEKDLAIRQIINSALVSEDVVDIFEVAGLDKPNIGILDDAFLEDVRNLPERNLAVELLQRLISGEIHSRFASNVVQQKKFSDMLDNVVKRYQNRAIETAQVIEELIQMAKAFQEAIKRGAAIGLNPDELAFYDALANNEEAVRELGDEILKAIAHELAESLRKSITVDWSKRESVRARIRILIRQILRRYRYPPTKQDDAVKLVLDQAESLGEKWAA